MGVTDDKLRGRITFDLPGEAAEAEDFIEWSHGWLFPDGDREKLERALEKNERWFWVNLNLEEEKVYKLEEEHSEKLAVLKEEYEVN